MASEQQISSENGAEKSEIAEAHVSEIKLPRFWPKKVSLWFLQIEAAFEISRISRDHTKYTYVLRELSPEYLEEVEDIIASPPAENKYEALKTALIKRLTESDSQQARKLLENVEMGDKTPTQFWRYMRKLANGKLQDDFLLEMWKRRLPSKVQQILAANKIADGNELAEIADRVYEVLLPERIAAINISEEKTAVAPITTSQATNHLGQDEFRRICQEVCRELNRQQDRGRSPSRSRGTARGRSRSREKYDICWYHYKFRDNCRPEKCVPPCKYKGPEN